MFKSSFAVLVLLTFSLAAVFITTQFPFPAEFIDRTTNTQNLIIFLNSRYNIAFSCLKTDILDSYSTIHHTLNSYSIFHLHSYLIILINILLSDTYRGYERWQQVNLHLEKNKEVQ